MTGIEVLVIIAILSAILAGPSAASAEKAKRKRNEAEVLRQGVTKEGRRYIEARHWID